MKKFIYILSISITFSLLNISCSNNSNTPKNDGHEHTYSEKWSFNEKFHWKKAICSGSWDCEKRISHKGIHTFSEFKFDEEIFKETGKLTKKQVCSVCNNSIVQELDFPIGQAIDSEGQGIKIKFFLPENVFEISFLRSDSSNSSPLYYSRILTYNNQNENYKLQEKELIWNDPYVKDGKEYTYYISTGLEKNGTRYYSNNVGQNINITIKSKGGLGEFKMTNTPSGSFNPETNTFTIDVKPEFTFSDSQTFILLNNKRSQYWSSLGNSNQLSINKKLFENWFGYDTIEVVMDNFAVTGNISPAWPYSEKGELFYRSSEGGFILSKEPFTIKKQ